MTIDEIKQKYNLDEYALDIAGAGVIDPNYKFKTNVGKRLGAQRGNGRVMTIQQYGKPQNVLIKKDGVGFSVVNRHGERIYRQSFKTYEDAFKLARKDGFMVVKDSVDNMDSIRNKYATDAYDLGIRKTEIDPKAPLKIISVTTRKERDGISGRVSFTKGNKKLSERFMVYTSGNWDQTPFDYSAYGYSASDREALMKAVRNKLSTLGIKAK